MRLSMIRTKCFWLRWRKLISMHLLIKTQGVLTSFTKHYDLKYIKLLHQTKQSKINSCSRNKSLVEITVALSGCDDFIKPQNVLFLNSIARHRSKVKTMFPIMNRSGFRFLMIVFFKTLVWYNHLCDTQLE